jgi:acyl carrier protein
MTDTETEIKEIILSRIAEQIGVDIEDIDLEDSLIDDLHLNTAEITDILAKLSDQGLEVEESEFENIDTVSDLIDHILSQPGVI